MNIAELYDEQLALISTSFPPFLSASISAWLNVVMDMDLTR